MEIFECPNNSWTIRNPAPPSNKWDANVCLNVWGEIFLLIPDEDAETITTVGAALDYIDKHTS